MQEIKVPEEVLESAQLDQNTPVTHEAEKAVPTTEEMQQGILTKLSSVDTLSDLAITFDSQVIKNAFQILGLNHSDYSVKMWEISNQINSGKDIDPQFLASEFPPFMQTLVKNCVSNELRQQVDAQDKESETNFAYDSLADLITGSAYGEDELHSALKLAQFLGESRGKSGGKEYTMAELAAVMKTVAQQLEVSGGMSVTNAEVSELIKNAYQKQFNSLTDLSPQLLTFFTNAIATHTRGVHANRQDIKKLGA